MGLWSKGSAARQPAHLRRCSPWEPVHLHEARKRPVRAASLMMKVRKLAADREAAEDDRWFHRSSQETAELAPPNTTARAKWRLRKRSIALNPPLESQILQPSASSIHRLFACETLIRRRQFGVNCYSGRVFKHGDFAVKVVFLVMLFSALLLPNEATANACSIPRFNFRVTSQGPWPVRMAVQSGKSCGSRRWSFGGIFKQLYLASPPHHGKVVLSFPGGYRYFPSPGYLGDDTFTLKICGALNGGFEGCADLLFSVTVVPPGA